jgi:TRAP-type C4-dicarboxylate transport system permease small subunit
MDKLLNSVLRASKTLNFVAASALTLMICVTVVDVFLRAVGRPVVGAYEVVSFFCAPLVIGFAIPLTSWNKNHVAMDFLLVKLAKGNQNVLCVMTRIICILLFAFIGFNLFLVASEFRASGEVSQTLRIPFYPVAYGVGVCCFLECLVFVCDIIKIWREET